MKKNDYMAIQVFLITVMATIALILPAPNVNAVVEGIKENITYIYNNSPVKNISQAYNPKNL